MIYPTTPHPIQKKSNTEEEEKKKREKV